MAIYLDNAATTSVYPEVLEAMMPYFTDIYGNASSVHSYGRAARKAVDGARKIIADSIGAMPSEIYFTSCGTESDNWAIRGAARSRADRGRHIITTAIEHHAVLNICAGLEREDFEVTYIKPGSDGIVSAEEVKNAIRPDTVLISVMAANNETGALQPIGEIAAAARERGILFHTDAVQAAGNINIDVKAQNIDMLSVSGHKLHAPKGIGVMYIRKGVFINRLMYGGAQERGQRPGTENTAYIAGLGKAFEMAFAGAEERRSYVRRLRGMLEDRILSGIPGTHLNGPRDEKMRLPGISNISFEGVSGESLLLCLDMKGIAVSSGSACTAGSQEISHVLLAMGIDSQTAQASIRFSLSDTNTEDEIRTAAGATAEIVKRLRDALKAQEAK